MKNYSSKTLLYLFTGAGNRPTAVRGLFNAVKRNMIQGKITLTKEGEIFIPSSAKDALRGVISLSLPSHLSEAERESRANDLVENTTSFGGLKTILCLIEKGTLFSRI